MTPTVTTLRRICCALCVLFASGDSVILQDLTDGIQVYRFQSTGQRSYSYISRHQDLSSAPRTYTLCFRLRFFYLWQYPSFFEVVDLSLEENKTSMVAEVNLDFMRVNTASNFPIFVLRRRLRSYVWYSFCLAFGEGHAKLYLGGKEESQTELPKEALPLKGNFLKVGAESAGRSFSGEITQMNLWGQVLSHKNIRDVSSCRSTKGGDVIAWEGPWEMHGDVTLTEVSSHDICQNDLGPDYFVFPGVTAADAFHVCEGLGGKTPTPKTLQETKTTTELAVNVTAGDPDLCSEIWIGATDIEVEGRFLERYDKTQYFPPWSAGEPNGYIFQNCLAFVQNGVHDLPCNMLKCALCNITERPVWTLLGACQQYQRNTHFICVQDGPSQLNFLGYSDYRISHEVEENRWVWKDRLTNAAVAQMPYPQGLTKYPMGRQTWILEQAVCDKKKGEPITLLLSPCRQGSYTCNDSTCIPLRERCDRKKDCPDGSDEINCRLVHIPPQYRLDLPPRNVESDILPIPVSVLLDIENIDVQTSQMLVHLKFNLTLTWQDARLTFLNLNSDHTLNRMLMSNKEKIWVPRLDFTNAKDNVHTLNDYEAMVMVSLRGTPSTGDDTKPEEVEKYPGWQTPLSLQRKYSVVFQCQFQLSWYPFDKQICLVVLTMLEVSSRFVVFNRSSSFASYSGGMSLVEYTFDRVGVEFHNDKEFAVMHVQMHLTRRAGFILMTVYIPSLCLIVLTYLTLFFKHSLFQVRVLASLTSLLVMATLFSKVSSSLPKTSYFKLVDVWLLSSILVIFIIIVFHLVIDRAQERATARGMSSLVKVSSTVDSLRSQSVKPPLHLKLILISRISVFVLIAIFNLIYWIIALAQ